MNIINEYNNKTCNFAKSELKDYLSRMGNPDFTITLKIVTPAEMRMEKLPDFNPDDSYCIHIDKDTKLISANNPRALLIAVYRYLTIIGCRFLRPGKAFEIVPVYQSVEKFYAREEHSASLRHRGICIEGTDSIENIRDMLDFLPKLGYNSFFFQFKTPHTFLKRWYEYSSESGEKWQEETSEKLLAYFDDMMEERGLLRHRMGHGWTAEIIGAKNLYGWDSEEYHVPDDIKPLVALVGGKRALFGGVAVNTNLCFSNEAALNKFSDLVETYLDNNPGTEYLHIWLADGQKNFCECDACCNMRPSDQYIMLLNHLDACLTKKGSDTKLCLLMYEDLLWAPIVKRLNNPDRFTLMFAPIHRSFNTSYKDVKNLPEVPQYKLNKSLSPKDTPSNIAFLKEWKEKVPCDSFAYDYYLGRAHHSEPSHLKISKMIYDDLHTYKDMDLNGIISCQELRCAFPNSLPNYVMGKAALNLNESFEDIADEYYTACYGDCGKELYKLMEKLSKLFHMDYINYIFCPIPRTNPDIAKNMEMADSELKNIEALILKEKGDLHPVQSHMWREIEFFVRYSYVFTDMVRQLSSGLKDKAEEIFKNEFIPLVTMHEKTDQASLDVSRVIHTIQSAIK